MTPVQTRSLARKLEEACPVDIFAASDGGVRIVDENLDERALRALPGRLAAGSGAIKVYDAAPSWSGRPDQRGDHSRAVQGADRAEFQATSASRSCGSRTTRSRVGLRWTSATCTPAATCTEGSGSRSPTPWPPGAPPPPARGQRLHDRGAEGERVRGRAPRRRAHRHRPAPCTGGAPRSGRSGSGTANATPPSSPAPRWS